MIDNSTHYFPYPFTYQPDPIITRIEPAESFLSGGRLMLIYGQHLSSPQSIKLMLYHEHKHQIINGTSCMSRDDSLIICMSPAIQRSVLLSNYHQQHAHYQYQSPLSLGLSESSSSQPTDNWTPSSPDSIQLANSNQSMSWNPLEYRAGGIKLRMFLIMDEVKSVRNLDEYYHHLPHHLTYFEDPRLFKLTGGLVEYSDELIIEGANLEMAQLEQDIRIQIGHPHQDQHQNQVCLLKRIESNRLYCQPPPMVAAQFEPATGKLLERANLPIVGLVGSNLIYHLGHMQYSSQQYLPVATNTNANKPANNFGAHQSQLGDQQFASSAGELASMMSSINGLHHSFSPIGVANPGDATPELTSANTPQLASSTQAPQLAAAIMIVLSSVSFLVALVACLVRFGVKRGSNSKFFTSSSLATTATTATNSSSTNNQRLDDDDASMSKYEREYKRIQLQMGSLDINGQPIGGAVGRVSSSSIIGLGGAANQANERGPRFGSILAASGSTTTTATSGQQLLFSPAPNHCSRARQMSWRALDYITSGIGSIGSLGIGSSNMTSSRTARAAGNECASTASLVTRMTNNNRGNRKQAATATSKLLYPLAGNVDSYQHHNLHQQQSIGLVAKLTPNGNIISNSSAGPTQPALTCSRTGAQPTGHPFHFGLAQANDITSIDNNQDNYHITHLNQHQRRQSPTGTNYHHYHQPLTLGRDGSLTSVGGPKSQLVSSGPMPTSTNNHVHPRLLMRPPNGDDNSNNNNGNNLIASAPTTTTSISCSSSPSSSGSSASSSQQSSPGGSSTLSQNNKKNNIDKREQQNRSFRSSLIQDNDRCSNLKGNSTNDSYQVTSSSDFEPAPSHFGQHSPMKHQSLVHQQQLRNLNNWTQEAPSTVLPYAVIEACNLTMEGKNAIKNYV